MREYLTSEDLSNQISMMRTTYHGVIIVVEGVTDQRLFEKFIDKDNVWLMQAHSKDKVKSTVLCMKEKRNDNKIIGIVDPDLDLVNGRIAKHPIYNTDCRDMEMMLIRSNAFNDVMDEYADSERILSKDLSVESIRNLIVKASSNIGKLMKISSDIGACLSFKDLDFRQFINTRTISCNTRKLIDCVISNTVNCGIGRKKLYDIFDEEPDYDPWIIARGHDTVAVFLLVLTREIGSFNARYLKEGELGGSLRLAFSDEDFKATSLYAKTESWSEQTGNPLWDMINRI